MNYDKSFKSYLKKYKLDDLLFHIAKISHTIFRKKQFFTTVHHTINNNFKIQQKQEIPIWDLLDITYVAILSSNDYKSKKPKEETVYRLYNTSLKFKHIYNKNPNIKGLDILRFVGRKQFWFQDIVKDEKDTLIYNFIRYYILLNDIPNDFPEYPNPNQDIQLITGFTIKEFSKLLSIIFCWIYGTNTPEINLDEINQDIYDNIDIATKENIKKCLSYLTADYSFFRKPNYPNNPLFFKPIIKTDTDRLIISNPFILAKKFYECIFWILRDKYNTSQIFTNAFGKYYEAYTEKLLSFYSSSQTYTYEQIPEKPKQKQKSADWLIETSSFRFIVEQKSTIMSIALKKEYPDTTEDKSYLEKFAEAFEQLDYSEQFLPKSRLPTIKIVLHFENLYTKTLEKEAIKDICKKSSEIQLNNFDNYFLLDTREFEQFIQLLSDDLESFNNVIKSLLEFEKNPPPIQEGREFTDVMNKNKLRRNIRFLDQHMKYFKNLTH